MLDFFSISQRGGETTIDNDDEEEIKNNKKKENEHKLSKSLGGGIEGGNYHTAALH